MTLSYLPNAITLLRILVVAPIAWLLWQMRYPEALVLMAIAGASDAVDGLLARRFDWGTEFGALVDPLADKVMVVAVFLVLTVQGLIPLWLAAVVVGRDGVILAGAGVYRLWFHEIAMSPTFISKVNTAAQILVLVLVLLGLCGFGAPSELAKLAVDPWCFYLVAGLSVASGLDYVVTWSLKAWRNARTASE